MKVDRLPKPITLIEVAERQPNVARELYNEFGEIVQQKGKPGFGVIKFETEIELGRPGEAKHKLNVLILEGKGGIIPKDVVIDIGMSTNEGQHVRLVLEPSGKSRWIYPGQSLLGSGFNPPPAVTAQDLEIHRQLLETLQQQS